MMMWMPAKERALTLAKQVSKPQGTGTTVCASVLLDSPVRELYLMQGTTYNMNCGAVHLNSGKDRIVTIISMNI